MSGGFAFIIFQPFPDYLDSCRLDETPHNSIYKTRLRRLNNLRGCSIYTRFETPSFPLILLLILGLSLHLQPSHEHLLT